MISPYSNHKGIGSYYRGLPFHIPSLVQRMQRKTYPSERDGVDSAFRMEYMGRAEFEFGTMPKNLKWMRSSDPESFVVKQITSHIPDEAESELWYVGRTLEFPMAEAIVFASFDDPESRPSFLFKERLNLVERILPGPRIPQTTGWWVLSPGHRSTPEFISFALFTTEEDAFLWKDLVAATS